MSTAPWLLLFSAVDHPKVSEDIHEPYLSVRLHPNNDKPVSPPIIQLSEDEQLLESVLIKGQRVSEKQKADPKSVEIMDLLAIKESPSISFYNRF